MSVAMVQARISELQREFALLAPARPTGGATATQFAAAMSAAALASSAGAPVGGAGAAGVVAEQAVVRTAEKYLGVPYVWGGTDPATGLDCSALVQRVYDDLGYDLPRVSHQQAQAGRAVEGGLSAARPGDILAFGHPVNHVALYVGDGRMIEAPRPGLAVRETAVSATPVAIRRILPDVAAGTLGPAAVDAASSTTPTAAPFASLFARAGAAYGVDPALLAAVAKQESAFDPGAVSPAGAQGLMQLMPATARGLGVSDPFDPAQAVDGAARLLRDLQSQFGRVDLALAAY
ncbi:transglycosylase SLT domain-containing protein, partial [Nocardioides massiliensis]